MALFPEMGPKYLDLTNRTVNDRDIKSRMEASYAEWITINQSFWGEADTDTRFEAGDQTLWNEIYGNLPSTRRTQFNFNRIRRVINMISGHQRRTRKSTIVTPRENSDAVTADQFTKLLMWNDQQEGILHTISDSFHGALVTGMNLLQVWIDYRNDPISGDIKVDNCSYNSFLIDPFFRKKDLSDCNGLWKRSWLTKQEVLSLLPDHKDTIMELQAMGSRDDKFQFMPENYNYGQQNLLAYDEYYYRDYRTQDMLVDTQTGESVEWKGDDDALKRFLKLYPQTTILKQEIPTVKLAVLVQGEVFYHGPNPLGIDRYPFVPVLGYYNPQIPYYPYRIQGVVRGLRDAQYLYNRRRIIELDMLESQVTTGWIFKENALVNPKDVFLSGQGKSLALKEEANMSDVQRIQPPVIPESMIKLSELLAQEIQEISGVNEELLGSAMDDKAGVLAMLRQGAGLTTLQVLFDNLDYAQKQLGDIRLQIMQNNFTPGKVKRIIEEEPSPQFYNKAFGKYDSAVEEGLNTTTQRQMEFIQLLKLKEIGIPIPDDKIIEAATIQGKKELIEAIQAQKQQEAQAQQVQAQMAMEQQKAQTNLLNARAVADQGLGMERVSRINENEALAIERKAEARKDKEAALLDFVKAMKEVEGVDIGNLGKLMSLSAIAKKFENEQNNEDTQQQGPVGLDALKGFKNAGNGVPMPGAPQEGVSPQGLL